ncbi:MAG: HU family DNA-binding protein [Turneriella sp.]|nr:HU family DNA-binding protein [Turneriella sp.]
MDAKKPLSKNQLIAALADKTQLSKKAVASVLDALTEVAYAEAKAAGKFQLPGIGTLKLVQRPERMGRNPATGEQIKIPAKTVVKFTVAKSAKDAIAGSPVA